MSERVQNFKPPESMAKVVLYGAFDVAKKAVESQSPRAWTERIIGGINNVYPKLSPDMQQFIATHHKGIEDGAILAGVSISTAEMIVAFAFVQKGLFAAGRRINMMRNELAFRNVLKQPFYEALRMNYAKTFSDTKGFVAIAATCNVIFSQLHTNDRFQVRNRLIRVNGSAHAERQLHTIFQAAFEESEKIRARGFGTSVDMAMVHKKAQESWSRWKAMDFFGLDTVLQSAGVHESKVLLAFRKMQNRPDAIHKDVYATLLPVHHVEPTDSSDAIALRMLRTKTQNHDVGFRRDFRSYIQKVKERNIKRTNNK